MTHYYYRIWYFMKGDPKPWPGMWWSIADDVSQPADEHITECALCGELWDIETSC